MVHYVPTVRSQKDGFEQLAIMATAAKGLWADRLEVDFSHCSFFEANMASPLAAVLARVADSLSAVEIVRVNPQIERILRKNGFLVAYGYSALGDSNRTTLPFSRMRLTDQGRFADYLGEHLEGKGIPRMTEGLGRVFRQSIFEVFQNAVTHSGSDLGVFVCGQFYPQLQRLDLTVADAGVGIRTNVRRYLGRKISSVDAIRWVLQEGNTTKTGKLPGGVGLKFLRDDFIRPNNGKIQIASRQGFYEFKEGRETYEKLAADFPGTAVNLEINTADTSNYGLSSEMDKIF